MPIDYVKDDEHRRIRLVAAPPLKLDDITQLLDRQIAEKAWRYGVLVDARRAALSPADAGALFHCISERVARHGPNGPVAIVTREAAGVAGAQIFSFRSSESNRLFEVFWDIDEAEAWLTRTQRQP